MQNYRVECTYELLGKLENEIRQSSYLLTDIEYNEQVTFHIAVPFEERSTFESWLVEVSNDRVTFQAEGTSYLEEDR